MKSSFPTFYEQKIGDSTWKIPARFDVSFDFAYGSSDEKSSALYLKGKDQQWDQAVRLNWDQELDQENPLGYDDRFLPMYNSPMWLGADRKRRVAIRNHYQGYVLSQFLHGEQAALVAAGRLIEVLPEIESKQFAAQQAVDEARHVEIFSRLISTKLALAYRVDDGVQELIRQGMSDGRWDFVVLTTQILIEGLALGALQQLREFSKSPLIASATAYVMADEARHVSFGLSQLEPYYSQLSDVELRERSEFASEGLAALAGRLNPQAVWRRLDVDFSKPDEKFMQQSLPRLVDHLFIRVVVMLERLRLRRNRNSAVTAEEAAVLAARRLYFWGRSDGQRT